MRDRKEYHKKWLQENPEKNSEYQQRYRTKIPGMSLYRTAKQRAKTKGIPFNIGFSDLVFPDDCPILGFPLKSYSGTKEKRPGGRVDSYSIDRIVPELGYVKGNVQVISHKANAMKSNASKEELLLFADWIYKTYGNNPPSNS